MQIPHQAALLRIYTEEGRRDGIRALYESVVLKARAAGLAGATVLRGPMGYGVSAQLHTATILDLSANLPMVVEIVDAEDKLRAFADKLLGVKDIGLITLERVEVLHYGHADQAAGAAPAA
jgi:PII-like signaling protein